MVKDYAIIVCSSKCEILNSNLGLEVTFKKREGVGELIEVRSIF